MRKIRDWYKSSKSAFTLLLARMATNVLIFFAPRQGLHKSSGTLIIFSEADSNLVQETEG